MRFFDSLDDDRRRASVDSRPAMLHSAQECTVYIICYKYLRPLINLQRCANHAIGGDRSSPLRRLPVWKISRISIAQVARITVRAEVCALHCHRLCREILIRRCYCRCLFIHHSPVLPNSKFFVFDDDLLTSKNFCIRYIPPTEKNLVEGG